MNTHQCSLTFKNFYIALAYFFAHADRRKHSIFSQNGIKRVFLVPVWIAYSQEERGCERTKHTIEFLLSGFCDSASRITPALLHQLESYFKVISIPTPHAILLKEKEEVARGFYLSSRECVERAGIKLLEAYLRHRDEDRTESGECSKAGFGLVLSLDLE